MARIRQMLLYLLVLMGGAATMGVEMCASRLLAPYFGNSLPVWGLLIGLLLAYLAVGYFVGGRLADRHPQASLLYQLAAWAGFIIGMLPYLAHPILRYAVTGFANYQAGMVLGSLLGVLLLFAVPAVLLGCIAPFALRLSLRDTMSGGNVAGLTYALSTIGSLIGTFVPVFVLIPNVGTRRTMFIIALSLLAVAISGLLVTARRRALFYALLLALVLLLQLLPSGAIKPVAGLLYEAESPYNYVQVLQNGDEVLLKLNEGEGIQSTYRPQQVLTGYVYDYFLLVPFFGSGKPLSSMGSVCLIGLAGGTIARQYSAVFGPVSIDGIEIDPTVVAVAQRFFALNLPNLHIAIEDGRYFLVHSRKAYDVVIVDAYRPPYIPFQLTTVEFFRAVYDHLAENGVVAVNVARTETDFTLVDAIASTCKAVYPSVYILDTAGDLNSVVIATRQPSQLPAITAQMENLPEPFLNNVAARAQGRIREFVAPRQQVLTDDHAPVEQIVHAIVARYILGKPACEVQP